MPALFALRRFSWRVGLALGERRSIRPTREIEDFRTYKRRAAPADGRVDVDRWCATPLAGEHLNSSLARGNDWRI